MDMLILFLTSAVVFGWIESFAMENGFQVGAPNFLGFKLQYHGAILLLAILVGIACRSLTALPWWALVEDIAFWASSKWAFSYKFRLTEDSWITRMMDAYVIGTVMVPVVWVALLFAGYFTFTLL